MNLYICSATKQLVLSLYDSEKEIDKTYHIGNNDHSKTLMPLLDELLKRNNISIKEIENIIVSNGPGSYTGVRIGVVVAKSLALFNEIPLYKVSSLEAIASGTQGIVAPSIDARREHVFAGIYEVSETSIKVLVEDSFITTEKYLLLVEEYKATKVSENFVVVPQRLNTTLADVYAISPDYLRKWSE